MSIKNQIPVLNCSASVLMRKLVGVPYIEDSANQKCLFIHLVVGGLRRLFKVFIDCLLYHYQRDFHLIRLPHFDFFPFTRHLLDL